MIKATKIDIDTKTLIRFWLIPLVFSLIAFLLFKARGALLILGAALFLALAISPLINKIRSILPSKNRNTSITIAYILVVGFLIGFISIVTPTIINESIRFANNFPKLFADFNNSGTLTSIGNALGIEDINQQLGQALGTISANIVTNLGSIVTTSLSGIASGTTAIILILVLSLFMLLEGPTIMHNFWKGFRGDPSAKRASRVINKMAQSVSKFVSNAILVGLINASCTAITVFILSFIFHFSPGLALPFGLITGVASLIPMFGAFIGGSAVAILLGFNAIPAGIIFFIYTIIYLQIESNIISPKIQGKGFKLPVLAVLSAVTIGVYMFGLIGALIAIPIAACIKVFFEEYGDEISLEDIKN